MSICNRDCFNCEYSDCICDEPSDDLRLDYELDLEIKLSNKYNAQRKYRQTEKGKLKLHEYNTSEKAKARMNIYNKSEKGKERSRRFEQTEKRKEYKREWARRKRLNQKLLQNNL